MSNDCHWMLPWNLRVIEIVYFAQYNAFTRTFVKYSPDLIESVENTPEESNVNRE